MNSKHDTNDWVSRQLRGTMPPAPSLAEERRGVRDRRTRVLWSVAYGSFNPRRRNPPRRTQDTRFHFLDWHASHLLFVSISILLLCVCDAFLTLGLLSGGANEINPIMALVVDRDARLFAAVKMALTGVGIVCMVLLARYRFMRLVRVETALYGVLLGYICLVGYEFWLLGGVTERILF